MLAARIVEEERNVPSTHDVIRISQCKCTASDIKRMEKIISEKLHYELEATTTKKGEKVGEHLWKRCLGYMKKASQNISEIT